MSDLQNNSTDSENGMLSQICELPSLVCTYSNQSVTLVTLISLINIKTLNLNPLMMPIPTFVSFIVPIVLLSYSYRNTSKTLTARYSRHWQSFFNKIAKEGNKDKQRLSEMSVSEKSQEEAYWMSITFTNTFFTFLSMLFCHLLFGGLIVPMRLILSPIFASGLVFLMSK